MTTILVPINAHALPNLSPAELMTLARNGLAEAAHLDQPAARYAAAHLAALRAAGAVLAVRARPAPVGRRRLTSVWVVLTIVAPELGEWAAFWAAGAAKRSAAEAGIGPVTAEDADRLHGNATTWITVVEEAIK